MADAGRIDDGDPSAAQPDSGSAALELDGVEKRYSHAGGSLTVLRGVDFRILPGQLIALVGPSGSGKSTLLHIAGLLERPTAGRVLFDGRDCSAHSDTERTGIRRGSIGFVYQFHHLLPEFSALENVMIPQLIDGEARNPARKRAETLLAMVGLSERASHRPARMSGGEQQRVAFVRAVANRPRVLLADEPTGNLDPVTSGDVFGHLRRIIESTGIAALIATHNYDLARNMDRIVTLSNGRLVAG